jgi:hypothetical protein
MRAGVKGLLTEDADSKTEGNKPDPVAADASSWCCLLMRRQWLVVVLVVASLAPMAGAMAQSGAPTPSPTTSSSNAPASSPSTLTHAPEQVVWLRSGAVVRGAVVEFLPNEAITLELATGEVRRIPWEQVERTGWVDGAAPTASTSSLATASATASASASASASAAPSTTGVVIHLLGDRPRLRLEARPRHAGTWITACEAPCGRTVDVYHKALRVTGPDTRPSNPFFIDAREGEETLDVSAGSDQVHRWGQGALIAGVALALAGGLAYGLGRMEDSDEAVIGGVAAMAIGGVGVAVSLPLIGSSGTTVRNGQGDRVGTREDNRRVW